MANTQMQQKPKISFYVFLSDGSRNPDIRNSFIHERKISAFDAQAGYLTFEEDNTKWTLVLERSVSEALTKTPEVQCIISMQVRSSGNYAVCRLYDPRQDRRKRS